MKRSAQKSAILFSFLLLVAALQAGCIRKEVKPAQVGDKAPEFSFKDIGSETVTLSNWKNQPVIIRFWETDCPFCRADTPVFVEFYNEYKDRGLNMVYIGSTSENIKEIRSFIDEYNLDFHVMMDPVGQLARMFSVRQYPRTLILSPDHTITISLPGGVGRAELDELVGIYFHN